MESFIQMNQNQKRSLLTIRELTEKIQILCTLEPLQWAIITLIIYTKEDEATTSTSAELSKVKICLFPNKGIIRKKEFTSPGSLVKMNGLLRITLGFFISLLFSSSSILFKVHSASKVLCSLFGNTQFLYTKNFCRNLTSMPFNSIEMSLPTSCLSSEPWKARCQLEKKATFET